ncbi:MAG TPA: carboxymuconolactone decarboxylase family protein [Quisquiliibacterium sp.]|nr:carboxymuconolactone decarboxylase family protein [Quisquiliibacterium sp.]
MPVIPKTSEQPDDPALRAIFDEVRGRIDRVPDLYRLIGHSPALLRAWIDFAWPLRLNAKTSRATRELLILRGAQIGGVDYEWAHHIPMALEAGVPQAKIDALASWQDSPLFDARERAVLRLADEVTRGSGASEACMQALGAFYNHAEIVELTLTSSFYVCVSRFLTSMRLELEPDYEHLRLKKG